MPRIYFAVFFHFISTYVSNQSLTEKHKIPQNQSVAAALQSIRVMSHWVDCKHHYLWTMKSVFIHPECVCLYIITDSFAGGINTTAADTLSSISDMAAVIFLLFWFWAHFLFLSFIVVLFIFNGFKKIIITALNTADLMVFDMFCLKCPQITKYFCTTLCRKISPFKALKLKTMWEYFQNSFRATNRNRASSFIYFPAAVQKTTEQDDAVPSHHTAAIQQLYSWHAVNHRNTHTHTQICTHAVTHRCSHDGLIMRGPGGEPRGSAVHR